MYICREKQQHQPLIDDNQGKVVPKNRGTGNRKY